jgi:hypothetical protein
MAAVSLSRDESRYGVGEPSVSWPINFGDEDMGRSLGGEDIVREKKLLLWVHKCYEEMLSRGVRTRKGIIETPDVRNQTNSANFTTGDDPPRTSP